MSSLIQSRILFIFHDFSRRRPHNVMERALESDEPGFQFWIWGKLLYFSESWVPSLWNNEIYESNKYWIVHSRSPVLTQCFLDNILSFCPPRARLFWNLFLNRELEIMKNTKFSHKKSKLCSFPYLSLLVAFSRLSSIPFQALLGKAQGIYLIV